MTSPSRPIPFRAGLEAPRTPPASHREQVASHAEACALLRSDTGDIAAVFLDVFDTVITRACGQPHDLFTWLGRRLHRAGEISVTPEVFARTRETAEAYVWQRDGGLDSDVNLATIYDEVGRVLRLDEAATEALSAAEFALELEVSRPVPGARELIAAAGSRPLMFVSDTYLDQQQVAALLRRHGIVADDSKILVSSDLKESKSSGRLIRRAIECSGVDPSRILFVGDNPHSDVDVPRSIGLEAAWLHGGRLNRFEHRLCDDIYATSGLSSSLAGASRIARLSVPVASDHDRAIRDISAAVVAPALIGYVLWCLERAQALGLRRLYFLARDGQILARIASGLVARLDLGLDVHYLAVSRRTTNLAATFGPTVEETDWVTRDVAEMTGAQLLERLGLAWSDVAHAHPDRSMSQPPSVASELRWVIEASHSPGPIRDSVLAAAAASRATLRTYLCQEGLGDDTPTGLVDFGGVGSQVRALHAVITDMGAPPPHLMLVGLDDPVQAGVSTPAVPPAWLADVDTWLYDHRRNLGRRRRRGFGTLFQAFCAAEHGTVVGYGQREGRWAPVFSVDRDNEAIDWGLGLMWSTIDSVVAEMELSNDLIDIDGDLRGVTVELVDMLWKFPQADEAAAWGAFRLEGAGSQTSRGRPLAWAYSLDEVRRGVTSAEFPDLGWQHWFEGSVVMSPAPVRAAIEVMRRSFEVVGRSDRQWARGVGDWFRRRRS